MVSLPSRIGPFQIEAELGAGGMAMVYRAHRDGLRRPVALKVLRPGRSRQERERFVAEGRLARTLSHPNLVKVVDVDLEAPDPWIAFDLVEGKSLAELIETSPVRAQRLAPRVCVALLEALKVLQDAGLSHRDVNPANVLVSDKDEIRLADLGMADRPSRGLAGTPAYLAPEAFRGDPLGPEADVYQVGATVYECLAGCVPHEDKAVSYFDLRKAPDKPPTPLTALLPGVSPSASALLDAMLAPDPGRRPSVLQAAERARSVSAPWFHAPPVAELVPGPSMRPVAQGGRRRGPRARDAYQSSEPIFYYKEEEAPAGWLRSSPRFVAALVVLVSVALLALLWSS